MMGHSSVSPIVARSIDDEIPVRIARDAIATAVPRRDILIAPDHPLPVDGVLVPAALLCNCATIRREPGAAAVDDLGGMAPLKSAILLAEGPALHAIHAELVTRALALGWRRTEDPALHIRLPPSEAPIAPTRRDHGWYAFPLPGGVREVELLSRSIVPRDCDPESRDLRRLGVKIDRIVLRCRQREREFRLTDRVLGAGFHPLEHTLLGAFRWTDGRARLRFVRAARTRCELLLHVEATQAFWVPPDEGK
jgi:hypothetical protein